MRKLTLFVLPVALIVAPLAFAAAQTQPQAPAPVPAPAASSQSTTDVDSATLHKFADAYEAAQKLRPKYVAKLQNAKTDDEKTAIQKEAATEMKKAIGKHMPVDQYQKTSKEIGTDPALRNRLVAIVRNDQKKPSSQMPQGH